MEYEEMRQYLGFAHILKNSHIEIGYRLVLFFHLIYAGPALNCRYPSSRKNLPFSIESYVVIDVPTHLDNYFDI